MQRAGALEGYARGFRIVFLVTVGCMVIATVASASLVGQHSLVREDDKMREEVVREDERMRKEAKRKDPEAINVEKVDT